MLSEVFLSKWLQVCVWIKDQWNLAKPPPISDLIGNRTQLPCIEVNGWARSPLVVPLQYVCADVPLLCPNDVVLWGMMISWPLRLSCVAKFWTRVARQMNFHARSLLNQRIQEMSKPPQISHCQVFMQRGKPYLSPLTASRTVGFRKAFCGGILRHPFLTLKI